MAIQVSEPVWASDPTHAPGFFNRQNLETVVLGFQDDKSCFFSEKAKLDTEPPRPVPMVTLVVGRWLCATVGEDGGFSVDGLGDVGVRLKQVPCDAIGRRHKIANSELLMCRHKPILSGRSDYLKEYFCRAR